MSVQSLGCNANIQVARCLCTTLGQHWGFHVCSNRNSWRTRAAHYRTCALDPFVRCANLATAGERGLMPSGCLLQNQLLAVTTDPLSHSLLSNFESHLECDVQCESYSPHLLCTLRLSCHGCIRRISWHQAPLRFQLEAPSM